MVKKQSVIFGLMILAVCVSSLVWAATPKSLNAFSEGERVIYSRLVEAYRKGQLDDVAKQRTLLERNYPLSVHLDNALYLNGMLEFQNGRMGEAVKTFNRVTDNYPRSGKRPGALFGLAMAYQKLNLRPQSVRVLHTIIKEYPGSPESKRAQMQLRVAKAGSIAK